MDHLQILKEIGGAPSCCPANSPLLLLRVHHPSSPFLPSTVIKGRQQQCSFLFSAVVIKREKNVGGGRVLLLYQGGRVVKKKYLSVHDHHNKIPWYVVTVMILFFIGGVV
mmetsp:Transcript_31746/g.51631  ORF Transcript_31746/g.51631 Transcript_31746/m.51631 type:complete len:110 (-) Transcript_31746:81-410(-)